VLRFTFYAESDDFSYRQSVDDAREWLRARGMIISIVESLEGRIVGGSNLDDLSEAEVGRWVIGASMGIVRKKAEERGYISFFTDRGDEWVAVFAGRIQAIGSSVEVETGATDDTEDPQWSMWTEQEPTFTD
jgi:hypothetical protein